MSTPANGPGGEPQPGREDEQTLAREIERTREELGETVAALAAKTDVKARASAKAHELTGRFAGKAGELGERARGREIGGAATARQAGQRVAGAARRYPVPTAAAAAAVLLAIFAAARGRRS